VVLQTLRIIKPESGISDIKIVFVGVAGQHIVCTENGVEKIRGKYDEIITQDEIEMLKDDAAKLQLSSESEIEVLHVIPQNYSIDEQHGILDPVGRLGRKLVGHFYVVTGRRTTKTHVNACMEMLKLSLQQLILEPIASARAILSDEEKEIGVAMIDIGGGTTDLIMYKDGTVIHTAVIPFGGNVITEDIKTVCSILYSQAEIIKIECGLLPPGKKNESYKVDGISGRPSRYLSLTTISKIISSRMNEILDMVLYEILRNTQQHVKLGAGIVVTGGVSKMKGIKEFIEYKLNEEAKHNEKIRERLKIEVIVGSPNYISDSDANIVHPKYSTAVGLVMCGFDIMENLSTESRSDESPKPDGTQKPDGSQNPDGSSNPDGSPDRWTLLMSWLSKCKTKIKEGISAFMNSQQDERND
ncbi:MAG: cell division protein FtsA, partial [Prevotellaceae bacterium]|nr:cell division protein FtsA [Prevotellaceae bacterium]